MTARQQIRVGRRLRGERAPIDATLAPSVGDLLHAAREKKGVDLYRAERDTKIRARHLSALEDGDYAELPGAVYTKGFLRNYALYLGLDPVEILDRWHDEQDPGQRASSAVMVAPPQPLTDPRRGFTFTPSLVVAAVLGLVVLLFVGYVGMQLFRFSQVPELSLDGPSIIQAAKDQTSVELTGNSPVHATVTALDAAGTMVQSTDSGDDGRWSLTLPVQKGSNQFTLTARDPETGRESPSRQVIIAVAVPATPTPVPTPAPTGLVALPPGSIGPADATSLAPSVVVAGQAALELTSPRDGARSNDPTVVVKGTTDAATVRVTAAWAGSGRAPARPDTLRLAAKGGSFSSGFVLAPGRWDITVTTAATDRLASTTQSHSVNVVYSGFVVQVATTATGRAWVQVFADGKPVPGSGKIMSNGDSLVVVAKQNVVVNTGFERATLVGIQGAPPEALGPRRDRGVWRLEKGKAPTRLQ
jgi:cytoskeletal protein RodZ